MAVRGAVILYNSSAQFQTAFPSTFGVASTGSSVSPSMYWIGGRTSLTLSSQTYPTSLSLQMQLPDTSWIQVGSGVLSTGIVNPTFYTFDAPPGQYRLAAGSGSSVGLYACLVGIQYGV